MAGHAAGNLQWHELLSTKYWLLPFNNATFQGEAIDSRARSIVIDTGTSLVLLPELDFKTVKQMLLAKNGLDFQEQASGVYLAKCSTEQLASISDLKFEVDNITYEVPKEALVSTYDQVLTDQSLCRLKVMQSPLADHWILGLNFFHGYYTVFDAGNQRIGFAKSLLAQGASVDDLNSSEFNPEFR